MTALYVIENEIIKPIVDTETKPTVYQSDWHFSFFIKTVPGLNIFVCGSSSQIQIFAERLRRDECARSITKGKKCT